MNFVERMDYNQKYTVKEWINDDGLKEKLVLYKAKNPQNIGGDSYFLQVIINKKVKLDVIGYIYFNFDFKNKASNFIGILIKDEFRNQGYALNFK